MKQNLTCFKCHNATATLTYEENRIYKVSCPCGCEYVFEHSSMKCAEEYHNKMLELYGEADRAKRLLQENQQLRDLLKLAVEDMRNNCDYCTNRAEFRDLEKCVNCQNNLYGRGYLEKWQWQHADKLEEMGIEV